MEIVAELLLLMSQYEDASYNVLRHNYEGPVVSIQVSQICSTL